MFVACGDVAGAANRGRRALASVEALYPRDALAPAMERARVAALLAAAGRNAKEAKTLADEARTTLRAHVGGDARGRRDAVRERDARRFWRRPSQRR